MGPRTREILSSQMDALATCNTCNSSSWRALFSLVCDVRPRNVTNQKEGGTMETILSSSRALSMECEERGNRRTGDQGTHHQPQDSDETTRSFSTSSILSFYSTLRLYQFHHEVFSFSTPSYFFGCKCQCFLCDASRPCRSTGCLGCR